MCELSISLMVDSNISVLPLCNYLYKYRQIIEAVFIFHQNVLIEICKVFLDQLYKK